MNEIVIIHEKNIPEPYPNKSSPIKINVNKEKTKCDYEVSNQIFHPTNSSPPNYFMNKLLVRIQNYDLCKNNLSLTIK
jgi:hypothetical protein